MATFRGHKNYNHFNVAAWIQNDEGLYTLAIDAKRRNKSVDVAAQSFIDALDSLGVDRTPDNVRFSFSAVKAAIQGL